MQAAARVVTRGRKIMKVSSAIAGGLLWLLAGAGAVAADEGSVYVWLDKDGTPHYQDRPPEGAAQDTAQQLNLRYRLTDAQAIAAASKQKAESKELTDLRERQQAEDAGNAEADRQNVMKQREDGCTAARERAQRYETAHRLYRPGPDGQRTYLSNEELDATRAEARREVEQWCGQ